MGKPLSWKWKLLIGFVIAFFLGFVVVFSKWGSGVMRDWIDDAYEECPAAERGDQDAADWFLRLAWWEGFVCGREEEAVKMYREFLGIMPKKGSWQEVGFLYPNDPRAEGYWDRKTKTGWGWRHPRAPEAYWRMLDLVQPISSSQRTMEESMGYWKLFYLYSIRRKGRPHPEFYKYWPDVQKKIMKFHGMIPPPVAPESTYSRCAPFYKQKKKKAG